MASRKQKATASSSGSDSDAPEAVSLSQSKRHVQDQESALQEAQLATKQKKREANRERDRKLKERAEENKGKRKRNDLEMREVKRSEKKLVDAESGSSDDELGEDAELEARMRRAMAEAVEEDDNDTDFGLPAFDEAEDFDDEDEEAEGFEDDSDSQYDGEIFHKRRRTKMKPGLDLKSDGRGSDEEMEMECSGPPPNQKAAATQPSKADHLPEELFAAAFQDSPSKTSTLKNSSHLQSLSAKKDLKRKKRRAERRADNLVLGSAKIRILPSSTTSKPLLPPTIAPSKKTRKFLDRSLALKGARGKPQLGWERRPANIGVLRGNGPAANFVRQS